MSTDRTKRTFAVEEDQIDPLKSYRNAFHFPKRSDGSPKIYLCGNSLGLQPVDVRDKIEEVLDNWADLGVEGHTEGEHPWLPYHEFLTEPMARVVGAKPKEVVVMNSLTVNLHLLMVSFYQPTDRKNKIVVEYSPFPSDRYAVRSQIEFHGYDPEECLIEMNPRDGEDHIRKEDIETLFEERGDEIAMVLFGGVNYYTGQAYDLEAITHSAHRHNIIVGFDLAHAAGNLNLSLHEDGADFAAWCNYKYLNSGPGALSGIFVHERHGEHTDLHRFAGWWGHDKESRFDMPDDFKPMKGAEGWQLSNPPILSMAPILASLEIFDEAGIEALREKSVRLTEYLIFLIDRLETDRISIITPRDSMMRGSQISLRVEGSDRSLYERLAEDGIVADWREPDVIRVAPVPLYNSFTDVFDFVHILKQNL